MATRAVPARRRTRGAMKVNALALTEPDRIAIIGGPRSCRLIRIALNGRHRHARSVV